MLMKKFEMLNVICQDCELTAKEKLVAQYFVYKSNKSGSCYPCVDKIAEDCSVSRRTVQRATKKLVEKEYIIKEKRFKFNKQTSNLYSFNILLLEQMQREKEILQEGDNKVEKADSTVLTMEVIELEELLNMENTYTIIEAGQEVLEDKEQGVIDLDDLIMSGRQEEYSIEFVQEEVPFKEPDVLEEKEEATLEAVKTVQQGSRNLFFSVSLLVWFICILEERDIKPGKEELEVTFTLIMENHNSKASRKIMGAFFPP